MAINWPALTNAHLGEILRHSLDNADLTGLSDMERAAWEEAATRIEESPDDE